jgi:hypothetical protein
MITSFEFETIEDFEEFAENARDRICSCILFSLDRAFEDKEEDTVLFDVSVKQDINIYEIFLNKAEWVTALNSCIEVFTNSNMSDEAIDAYLLIKKIKEEVEVSEKGS